MDVAASENHSCSRIRHQRLRILYIQPGSKAFAGIERVVDSICTLLAERYAEHFDVDVLYTSVQTNRPQTPRKYSVIERVARNRLGLLKIFRSVIKQKNYDLVVVPQIEPAVMLMTACLGLDLRVAVHLHGDPRKERSHLKAKILFFLMRHYFLRRVACVFGTSPRQLEAFKAMFASSVSQVWLPNPVRHFDAPLPQATSTETVTFVNVGRFAFQKGQDILVNAFAEVVRQRPNACLKLVGHGVGEAALRDQIAALGMNGNIAIEHHPTDPQPALSSSDVFVATSRWEGWSLAICEALRLGLPVVSTDCEFGPSDILIDSRLGRLIAPEDTRGLIEAMIYYCDNVKAEREHADFRKQYIDRFSPEKVIETHATAVRDAALLAARTN
jgi:glycosyltransferase involved in cell wall biosynthesis